MSREILPDYSDAKLPDLYGRSAQNAYKILDFLFRLNIVNPENVNMEGAGILAFSHRSLLDPWVLGAATPRAFGGLGKIEIERYPFVGKYLANRGVIYVDRQNANSSAIRAGLDELREERLFAMAIEGTHKNKGGTLGPTKDGAGYFAIKMESEGRDCPVIPVGMSTEDMHKHLRRPLNIVFGEPLRIDRLRLSTTSRAQLEKEFNQEILNGLQQTFDESLELQEWQAGHAVKIHQPSW